MSTASSPLGRRDLDDRAITDIDDTAAALEGGVGLLNPDTGARIVSMWRGTLEGSDWESARTVARLLGELEDALRADSLDAALIGDLMVRLAEATRIANDEAGDARLAPSLDRLAALLERAGQTLGVTPVTFDSPPDGGFDETA
jgi:hypothetical protein